MALNIYDVHPTRLQRHVIRYFMDPLSATEQKTCACETTVSHYENHSRIKTVSSAETKSSNSSLDKSAVIAVCIGTPVQKKINIKPFQD